MVKSNKERLDVLLVARGLCPSRQVAQRLIQAGEVRVQGQVVDKPGTWVAIASDVVVAEKPPYVSRGGEKLAKALEKFSISVTGRICLDGGISTGGFTDCLLQKGAALVYGVDVGYGQVAWKVRQDERVILRERTNFRYLQPSDLYGDDNSLPRPDLGVMDLSFISLTKVLETLWTLLIPPREVVLLVKPQFEVGRENIGKQGVVRCPQVQAQAIYTIWHQATELGWQFQDVTFSPITGPAGNVEYLLWLAQTPGPPSPTLSNLETLTTQAIATLTQKS